MPTELVWTCNPGPQEEFVLGALGDIGEIMYGGAKGGGKSDAIGPKALRHVAENPVHARVLILREDSGQIQELIDRMAPMCLAMGGTWVGKRKRWTFPGGAQIIFGHLLKGCKPYWGHSYSMIVVDELTRCIATEREYLMLLGSLRKPGVKCQMIVLTNPGGKGHAWVKARFKNVPPMAVQLDKNGLDRVFIPARLSDNPHLDNDSEEGRIYRAILDQLPDAERGAYLDGDWDSFEGQIFKLIPGVHTWTWAQFRARTGHQKLPDHWRRYRSYDHGLAAPGACYWYAMDEDNRAYVYREYYTIAKDSKGDIIPNKGADIIPSLVAKQMASQSEGEKYTSNWTGPDLFAAVRKDMEGGATIASHFVGTGIHFQAWKVGDGSRVAGKTALHERMYFPMEGGRITAWPHIVWITEECPHALRTLPLLERHKTNVESVDDTGEDHSFDSIAGFCKMQPLPTRPLEEPQPKWMQAEQESAQSGGRLG